MNMDLRTNPPQTNAMIVTALFVLLTATANASPPIVEPPFLQLSVPGEGTVRCSFPHPLTDCQMHVSSHYWNTFTARLDFRRGHGSGNVTLRRLDGHAAATASYAGSSLAAGHCGLRLHVTLDTVVVVECWGRQEGGGWSRGFALLAADRPSSGHVGTSSLLTPRLVVTQPGATVAMLLKSSSPLTRCVVWTSSASEVDLSPGRAPPDRSRYRRHGAGAAHGQCGAELTDVTSNDIGVWFVRGWTAKTVTWQMMLLLVEDAPRGGPEFLVANAAGLGAGDLLNATCRAPPGSPPPRITWLLDGKVVRDDDIVDVEPEALPTTLPWGARGVVQSLALRLKATHNRRPRLQCRMQHVSLATPLEASIDLGPLPSAREANVEIGSLPSATETNVEPEVAESKEAARCGLVGVATALVAGGHDAVQGQLPWHVGLYKWKGTSFEQVCGGTLVSSRLVISAAHCLYDERTSDLFPLGSYRVALGKVERRWDVDLLDDSIQRFRLSAVNITDFYAGAGGNYLHDIAVLTLRGAAVLTASVAPACLDWRSAHDDLQPATLLSVAGWGATAKKYSSPVLQWTELEVVAFNRCRRYLAKFNKRKLLTPDKLCAGWENRTISVCRGDSGGGLVLVDAATQSHFLVGVVSISFQSTLGSAATCRAEAFSGFTRISAHLGWLKTFF